VHHIPGIPPHGISHLALWQPLLQVTFPGTRSATLGTTGVGNNAGSRPATPPPPLLLLLLLAAGRHLQALQQGSGKT
jgi:hypothetical protein